MKIGTMFRDVVTSLFWKPVTEKYPFERREAPEQFRGRLLWDPANCTGCGLCGMDCPANAIQVMMLDKKAKRFVIRYHVDRCTFCAQCVFSCCQGSLSMSSELWELAGPDREGFTLYFGKEEDIREALESEAAGDPQSAGAE
jgi:formate hydrogenlyase subunit 6/NADH:ubiquinone oxidoreductase subunit I